MDDPSKTPSEIPERLPRFTTVSGLESRAFIPRRTFTRSTILRKSACRRLSVYPWDSTFHVSRPALTMRMFSGLGGPEETNRRFHYLLDHGETGLSIAFHYPTLMGYDSDSPMARGEIGKCGLP